MTGRFAEKVALVTGAASGIGAATATRFAAEGASVVVTDVDASGEAIVDAIRARGGEATFIRADVTSEDDVRQAIAAAEARYGRLELVVANAGITGHASRRPLADVTEEEWRLVIDVNLSGIWRTLKCAVPALRRAGGGAMTSTGSLAGVATVGAKNLGTYSTTKAGVVALTKYFASELVGDDIRVNCVCPGVVATNIDASYGYKGAELGERRAARYSSIGVSGEFVASAEQIASVHLFLCSDEASFITGEAVVVDGGRSLGLGPSLSRA